MTDDRSAKVAHVKRARQTRTHDCHWPGCGKQVPPAKWGCYAHWMRLPFALRQGIWNAYRVGQEEEPGKVTRAYNEAAKAAQDWIAARGGPNG